MKFTASVLASLVAVASASKDGRTFAVLRFNGDGFLTEGRVDPIVNPGAASAHLHGVMGGSNFGLTVEGDQLLDSNCTTAKIANDHSNYWVPEVFFQDPKNGSLTKVPLFYQNVYYFFEPTDDDIVAFPPGMKMISGNAMTRTPPAFGGGSNLDPGAGPIQPIQFTCPRTSYDPPSYPADSDGTMAGMQDPNNKGAGAGFPLYNCDGYASPLRADIHFPSCYNPAVGLDDYKNNMAWPTISDGMQNCPSGWIHVPHLFFEVYWNTPLFENLWTPDGKTQPFVLSTGDATGYSLHADFLAGWDENTLQTIINTCNAGDAGMDTCPQIPGGLSTDNDCKIPSAITEPESLTLPMDKLPGNNPICGWSKGTCSGMTMGTATATVSAAMSAASSTSAATTTSRSIASTDGGAKAVDTSATTLATSTFEAQAETSTSAALDGSSPIATVTTATAEQTATSTAEGNGQSTVTVWDVETVFRTVTTWIPAPTQAKRQIHDHDHVARHARRGHLGRK